MLESLELIDARFSTINNPDDFVSNDNGVLILDAIATTATSCWGAVEKN